MISMTPRAVSIIASNLSVHLLDVAWCRRPGRPGRVNRMLASPGNTQVRMLWQVVMRGGTHINHHIPVGQGLLDTSKQQWRILLNLDRSLPKNKALKKMVSPGQSITQSPIVKFFVSENFVCRFLQYSVNESDVLPITTNCRQNVGNCRAIVKRRQRMWHKSRGIFQIVVFWKCIVLTGPTA